jgi:hypothetical protein
MPVIGFLTVTSPLRDRIAAFHKALSELGFVEGGKPTTWLVRAAEVLE